MCHVELELTVKVLLPPLAGKSALEDDMLK
jgi:hypothetical protein